MLTAKVSNILELSNGHALKLLAVETKVENARTALMTRKAVEDAATVKVLTIITLVYLPLTVVTVRSPPPYSYLLYSQHRTSFPPPL